MEGVQRTLRGCSEGCSGDMQAIEKILGYVEGAWMVHRELWWGHVGN